MVVPTDRWPWSGDRRSQPVGGSAAARPAASAPAGARCCCRPEPSEGAMAWLQQLHCAGRGPGLLHIPGRVQAKPSRASARRSTAHWSSSSGLTKAIRNQPLPWDPKPDPGVRATPLRRSRSEATCSSHHPRSTVWEGRGIQRYMPISGQGTLHCRAARAARTPSRRER